MNIETAKRISIISILEKLGFKPQRETAHNAKYLSPIRKETDGSFFVYKKDNRWRDYGNAKSGDVVDLAQAYLTHRGQPDTKQDALQWLEELTGIHSDIPTVVIELCGQKEPLLKIVSVISIKNKALLRYIEDRGITTMTAKQYLKEVHYLHTQTNNQMFALGLKNDESGYELRSSIFKGGVGKKYLTFIRGSNQEQKSIHIFEGVFDFLAAMEQRGPALKKRDCIVLNSVSFVETSFAYIKSMDYRCVHTYMDNDAGGQSAREKYDEFVKSVPGLKHIPMNKVYAGYTDVNAWHVAKRNEPEVV